MQSVIKFRISLFQITEYNDLKEENKKLKEIIPLLEQRKIEIKKSNESLELRFSDMLQQLNKRK